MRNMSTGRTSHIYIIMLKYYRYIQSVGSVDEDNLLFDHAGLHGPSEESVFFRSGES